MGVFQKRSVFPLIKSEPFHLLGWFVSLWVRVDKLLWICLVILFVKCVGFVSRTMYILKLIHHVEILLEVTATYPIPLLAIAKMSYLLLQRHKFQLMFTTITDKFWDFSVGDNSTQTKIAQRYKFVNRFLFFHFTISIGHVVVHLVFPQTPIPEGRTRRLPVLISFPLNQDQSPTYELLYVVLAWNMFISIIGNAFFDLLFFYGAQHLWGQFVLLRHVLTRLDFGVMESLGDASRFKSAKFQKVIQRRIAVCANHHAVLLKYGALLKEITAQIFGLQLLTTSVALVLILYSATESLEEIAKSAVLLSIVLSSFLQVALFALQSSDIHDQSILVAEAAYQSKWYLFNAGCKRGLSLVILTSQQGISMSGAGLMVINNEIIVKMLQNIFSCITLLKSLQQDAF